MPRKIDVRSIVRDHFRTLTPYRGTRIGLDDLTVFFVVPVGAALSLVWFGVLLTDTAANVIATALSIFAGLLFNLLLLAHAIVRRADHAARDPDEVQLIREIYSNVSYAILLCVLCLVALLVIAVPLKLPWLSKAVSLVVFAGIGNFLMTLLMILKRIHILLTREFESTPTPAP